MKKLFLSVMLFVSVSAYSHSQILNELVYKIRDPETDFFEFRFVLRKIGEYLALDVLNELEKKPVSIQTLTGATAYHNVVTEKPVLVTILRAGLPLTLGVQVVFPDSEVGFLAMSRDEETLLAKTDYVALPYMEDKPVILIDTMLATGGSLCGAIEILKEYGCGQIYVIAAIAAQEGLENVYLHYPDVQIYSAAIDPILNDRGYIVPGLGDAGDRSYGEKYHR